jgi:wyosine [tRNA(Phe)-imidazoG37] synthetase (radical SAM superfamily)
MFDIDFYMRHAETGTLERSKYPVVYNIETTNACNMKCVMCPRTTMMTRPVETMEPELFKKIVDQIKPHSSELWDKWEKFAQDKYGIAPDEMSENHFFLYVIPKVIQLHGYGDPLLDKNMGEYVKYLTDRGFYSYFSCNPSNISIAKTIEMFESGLDYIKFSIESIDDNRHKEIRGEASNFTQSYYDILKILEIKKDRGLKTVVVITMLNLNGTVQNDEYLSLKRLFEGKDVYIYLKSEDTQWYRGDHHGTESIHWSEPCKHPWMSMTIKSNGEACQCMEDFNNAIVLGDAKHETLYDIWNGKRYEAFRQSHIDLTGPSQCTERCDMKLMGESC